MRQRGRIHLKTQARDAAQHVVIHNDLFDYFVGLAHNQRALRRSLRVEIGARDRRPSALLRDGRDGAGIPGEEVIDSLLRRGRDIAESVYTDAQLIGRVAESLAGFAIEINQRPETMRLSADNRDHQRKSKRSGACERLWRSANAQPY